MPPRSSPRRFSSRGTRQRRFLAVAVFAGAAAQILYALGDRKTTDRIHGAFVNPNNLAGYLEIALALAFGMIWTELLKNRERAVGLRDPAARLEKRAIPLVRAILVWGVIATAIGLTRSRGAVAAGIISTVLMMALSPLHPRVSLKRRRTVAGTALALFGGLLFVAIAIGNTPLLRFLTSDPREIGSDTRVQLWQLSVDTWRHFPIFGSGLGTFQEAFRRVQPRDLVGVVEHAHSDFLQLLATGGLIGAALGVLVVASALVLLFRAWLGQQHREEAGLILGAIGAIVSLVLHGIAEFNFSLPAIPMTLAVVVGMAWRARSN